MTRLAGALLALPIAVAGWAEVRLSAELGWGGIAVADAVNPLWITVENPSASVFTGSLHVAQETGSGWRGRVGQRLTAPLLLPPGGRARLLFPWPLPAGTEPLAVWVEADGREEARLSVPVRPSLEKPVAVVGSAGPPPQGPAVFLAPDELPAAPALLSPFLRVFVPATLPPQAAEALAAWAAFAGGEVEGRSVPSPLPPPGEEALRTALRAHTARDGTALPILGLTVAYLVLLGFALARLPRGRWAPLAALAGTFTSFALLYPVLYETPPVETVVQYSISRSDIARYSFDVAAVSRRRAGVVVLDGQWFDAGERRSDQAYSAIAWEWGAGGPRTLVWANPGKTVILSRYGAPWDGAGGRPGEGWAGGVAPLAVLGPLVRAGEAVRVEVKSGREGGRAWWVYRARWDRRG
ncbi:MAG: hypothetical protein N2320_02390 [Candidatus Bipolaricaulota bacterium]|nr:hypothetical protein [Candidatus Bipolaricaulota bacterium]